MSMQRARRGVECANDDAYLIRSKAALGWDSHGLVSSQIELVDDFLGATPYPECNQNPSPYGYARERVQAKDMRGK